MNALTRELAWELASGGPFPCAAALADPDERYMALALQQGLTGVGLSSPNPPVGCVLVKQDQIIGQGAHVQAGGPHGEIVALMDAEFRGADVQGATAYVTLEPCCHHGRTPPCTDALIKAGISRVVVGVRDPNPRVDGGGLAILKAHGIRVQEGVLGQACAQFHAPFFKLIRVGLPWVMLKLALGSDGSLGPGDRSVQITSPEVQLLAHALRHVSGAMVVGCGTVQIDDPQLTDRWPVPAPSHRTLLRVVLDSHGRLPGNLRVWKPVQGQPSLRAVVGEPPYLAGVEDLRLPPGPGGCSLRHLLHELTARGVGCVLFEGGGILARQILDLDLVDEFHEFRSDHPAGGPPINLDLSRLPRLQHQAPFPGGNWIIRGR
jgi:diaminohydroxyphosphoribosylaminopyrimidine deaminase / 5-amino-6-(5-phosphoribosylamino)uracil reductase